MAALRVLELLTEFWSAPRVLECSQSFGVFPEFWNCSPDFGVSPSLNTTLVKPRCQHFSK